MLHMWVVPCTLPCHAYGCTSPVVPALLPLCNARCHPSAALSCCTSPALPCPALLRLAPQLKRRKGGKDKAGAAAAAGGKQAGPTVIAPVRDQVYGGGPLTAEQRAENSVVALLATLFFVILAEGVFLAGSVRAWAWRGGGPGGAGLGGQQQHVLGGRGVPSGIGKHRDGSRVWWFGVGRGTQQLW